MILLRKNSFSETSITIPFKEKESIKDLVSRTISSNGYELNESMLNHFQVLINGLRVEKDLWEIIEVKESDQVLIAPILARGDGAQLFKTFAIIAITIAATYALGPAGYGLTGAQLGLAVAAVNIGTTLAMNSLIPPPGLPGMGGDLGGLEESQMYSVSSQSNTAKKYGAVPKVYGTHKMSPFVAANPYTEIEADPETKELVQYFYGLYDFGFGPAIITDLKIGDTRLKDFSNFQDYLVDFNRPAEDEGVWDEQLSDKLLNYKGDLDKNTDSYVLNKNSVDDGVFEDDFKVARNAAPLTENVDQEIILDFVCPEGLIGYATNGKTSNRTIELLIEYRKTTEPDNWRGFNDPVYLQDDNPFETTGGEGNIFRDEYLTTRTLATGAYDYISNREYTKYGATSRRFINDYYYGFRKGRTYIDLLPGQGFVGQTLYVYTGVKLGTIASISPSPISGYERCYFTSPVSKSHVVFTTRYSANTKNTFSPSYNVTTSYEGIIDPSKMVFHKHFSSGEVWVTDKTAKQKYFTVKFRPKEYASYVVRVTRVRSYSAYTYQVRDAMTLISVSTRFDRQPIVTDQRHVFLDLKMRATNQLNGAISNLSAVVTSVLDVYDPLTQTWSKQATNNPAWVFCDLLTGDINPRKIDKSRLHMDSIVEWANFCDEVPTSPPSGMIYEEKRFACNIIVDFETTLQALINNVCNAAQASLNIIDGKYGVLIDKLKTTPVQIFTPRNSWDFSSTRNYSTPPHALKIRFVSPDKDWQVDEAIVYDSGYDSETATEFQELSSFGCTEYEQAWRFGRYMMAQARLRQETMSITVDFEHIVCTRGDYVQITQDVMKVGGRPARVKSVTGNVVKIDDAIDTTPVPYGYVFRGIGGIETSTLTVIDSDEFELNGPIPSVGDLIVIGPVGNIVFDCLVKSINPNDNMSATLVLVEKADAVYQAESSDSLPEYNPQLNPNQDSDLAAPPAVEDLEVVSNTWRVKGGEYEYYIGLDWDIGTGVAYETFEVYVDSGSGYDLATFTKQSFYEYIVNTDNLEVEHFFKVLGVSATGKKITLLEAPVVSATPVSKITRPSDVDSLYINITNQVIQLEWPRISDPDLKEYLLRYSPSILGGTWESSIPFARISGITNTASVQGRTGTYFVKALDLNGNESLNSAQAVTSIPELFDLNIIDETNDFPSLPGDRIATEFDGEALLLKTLVSGSSTVNQYYPEGYYYYSNFLDLGEIYTVRLQSLIEAEGYTEDDLVANWNPLSEVEFMANAGNASWDVETYYRGTDSFNVMSEWVNLDSVDPISEGVQDSWSAWKKFQIGDFTARIFQFRLKLISNVASVTPRVFDGVIRADMPDRVESYNNLISTYTPTTVLYAPAFKGPGTTPNIQITQDNIESGDYYIISNKTLNGFDIIFYDVNNNPVIRTFDVAVKGYGRKALAVI